MESIYTKLALYGTKNECARTDNVFYPISEVCIGTVSLTIWVGWVDPEQQNFKFAFLCQVIKFWNYVIHSTHGQKLFLEENIVKNMLVTRLQVHFLT